MAAHLANKKAGGVTPLCRCSDRVWSVWICAVCVFVECLYQWWMRVCVYICVWVYIGILVCWCMSVYAYISVWVCVCVSACMCVPACVMWICGMYIWGYAHAGMHMHAHVCMCTRSFQDLLRDSLTTTVSAINSPAAITNNVCFKVELTYSIM